MSDEDVPLQYVKMGHVRDCLDAVPMETVLEAVEWALSDGGVLRHAYYDLIPTDERQTFEAGLKMLALRAGFLHDRAVMNEALIRASKG